MENKEIRLIEELLLNSMPAMQTVLLDGWVLRMNRNYTYRANCVCPMEDRPAADLSGKIKRCEELFDRNKLSCAFKVTPVLQKALFNFLPSLGYRNIKTVYAMRCALNAPLPPSGPKIIGSEAPDWDWLACSARLAGITAPDLVSLHCMGIHNLAVRSVFATAVLSGKTVGCGYGTVERGHVGLYGLHVEPNFRRGGIGTAICRAILRYGSLHGAQAAYLIVHSENQKAIRLYLQMGFQKLYSYSFFEKENTPYRIIDT